MEAIINNIIAAAQPLGDVIYLLIVTALIDTGSGIWAAAKSGTLDWSFIDTFVRSHVFQKWGPFLGTLLGGIAVGGTDGPVGTALIAAGVAQVAAYEAATLASVYGNFQAARSNSKALPSSVTPPKTK